MNTAATPTQHLTQAIEQLTRCAHDLAGAHRDVVAALPNLSGARNTRARACMAASPPVDCAGIGTHNGRSRQ